MKDIPLSLVNQVCDNCSFYKKTPDSILGECVYVNKTAVLPGDRCDSFIDKRQYPVTAHMIQGNISNTDVVIVYGAVNGNISNCDNVIVINGGVKGNIINCDNVAGLLAQQDQRHDFFLKGESNGVHED